MGDGSFRAGSLVKMKEKEENGGFIPQNLAKPVWSEPGSDVTSEPGSDQTGFGHFIFFLKFCEIKLNLIQCLIRKINY